MEKRYGSLSRGMLQARKQRTAAGAGAPNPASAPPPLFTSLKGGMQQLVDALVPQLAEGAARTGNKVVAIGRQHEKWMVAPEQGSMEEFDSVIMALPANQAGLLLERINAPLAQELQQIPYSSSMVVVCGYDMRDLASVPPGFGFLVPRSEGRRVLRVTGLRRRGEERVAHVVACIPEALGALLTARRTYFAADGTPLEFAISSYLGDTQFETIISGGV